MTANLRHFEMTSRGVHFYTSPTSTENQNMDPKISKQPKKPEFICSCQSVAPNLTKLLHFYRLALKVMELP